MDWQKYTRLATRFVVAVETIATAAAAVGAAATAIAKTVKVWQDANYIIDFEEGDDPSVDEIIEVNQEAKSA